MKTINSILGLLIALVVLALVWLLSYFALGLLASLRGEHDWLSKALNELIAPALGGYFAMATPSKAFKLYSRQFVFYAFSVVLVVATVVTISFEIPVAHQAGIGIFDFIWQVITPLVAIGVAFFITKGLLTEQKEIVELRKRSGTLSKCDTQTGVL